MLNLVDAGYEIGIGSAIRNTLLVQKDIKLGTKDVLEIEEIIGNANIIDTYNLENITLTVDLDGLARALRERQPKYQHGVLVVPSNNIFGSIAPIAALMRDAGLPCGLVAVSGGWDKTSGRYNYTIDFVRPNIR